MTLEFPQFDLLKAFLVLVRLSALLVFLPLLGDASTPVRARIILVLGLAFIFYPIAKMPENVPGIDDPFGLGLLAGREIVVAFAIGFTARIAFEGILMAANLVGFQMGFGTASLLVHDAGQTMNSFTAFHRIIILLMFFSLGLHQIFIQAIADSFEYLPIGDYAISGDIGRNLVEITGSIFVIAVELAAPVLVALMLTMAALGLMARSVPQVNVFTLSFPVSFFIGLLVYIATFSLYPDWLMEHFMTVSDNMTKVIKAFKVST